MNDGTNQRPVFTLDFEQIDWPISEGAYHVIGQAMKRFFRPDWKGVYDRVEWKASVRGICNP